MAELIANLPATTTVVSIAGYTMTGNAAADMAGIKAALVALMEAQTTNNTVGELDGKSIVFDVVYANLLNPACQQTVTYVVTFDTTIPNAQQALKDYVAAVPKSAVENFEGLCLEGTNLIADISGTGKMVELFAQISTIQSGGQISVLSVAGVAYDGTQENMGIIGLEIKALMMTDGRTTISDLDEVTITIPVVFANALNTGCTSLVEFEFTFDTSIPDNPLAITPPVLSPIENDLNSCGAVVSFAATTSGVPASGPIVYTIPDPINPGQVLVVESGYFFPVGTTTVTALRSVAKLHTTIAQTL
jgi:hypothetical protein